MSLAEAKKLGTRFVHDAILWVGSDAVPALVSASESLFQFKNFHTDAFAIRIDVRLHG